MFIPQIYEEIMDKGFSKEKDTFVMHYGSDMLDASWLIMPLVFFIAPNDPRYLVHSFLVVIFTRMLKLINAISLPPKDGGLLSNSLVFRYSIRYVSMFI